MVPRLLAGIAGTTAIPSPARRPSMGDGNERRVSRRRLRARTTTSSSESSRGSHDEAHEGQTVSISGSGAASGGLRVDSVGQKTTRGTPQPHPHSVGVGRRQSLGFAAAAAAAALSPVQSARAAYETQMSSQPSAGAAAAAAAAPAELSLYKRSFRQRFETSISAGTHDYSFNYPKETWKPDIVSLNDGKLYGVDLRFSSGAEGKMCTHVLPFVDKDSLKDVGTPDEALDRFVELIGAFWNENGFGVPGGNAGSVKSTKVVNKGGVVYYEYELTKPHNLISAAVTDGQLYVINASAGSERQWQQGEANLRNIVSSFYVPP
mmetsp:Transcript_19379/g.31371  ORF Transcript_19379/g.31371 Transcript_19379/m.31371 type:complete len:320 (-) Transcript_19379:240-1199(-)